MNRRDFIKDAAVASMSMGALSGTVIELDAQAAKKVDTDTPTGPPISVGIIGLGAQGREMLETLPRLGFMPVAAICDNYEPLLKRSAKLAPKATAYSDYRKLLEDKNVTAVLVATPSHLHKQIVLDALQAGKHVFCETPLAHTVEDARAIALAGKNAAPKLVFHANLQNRVHPQYLHVNKFVKTGVLGNVALCRSQWHKKTSWKNSRSGSAEQEKAVNWRLYQATSPGLAGEIGIHAIDTASWFMKSLPTAVSGFGATVYYKDGREVADTIQAVIEYPKGVHMAYDATLVNSFDSAYDLFQGSASAIFVRGEKAWMVNEADTPLAGWIVYASKQPVGVDTGVLLVADASKLLQQGKIPGKDSITDPLKTPLYYSLVSFLKHMQPNETYPSGALEGYQATVAALKTNEAIVTGKRIEFQKEWFELV